MYQASLRITLKKDAMSGQYTPPTPPPSENQGNGGNTYIPPGTETTGEIGDEICGSCNNFIKAEGHKKSCKG